MNLLHHSLASRGTCACVPYAESSSLCRRYNMQHHSEIGALAQSPPNWSNSSQWPFFKQNYNTNEEDEDEEEEGLLKPLHKGCVTTVNLLVPAAYQNSWWWVINRLTQPFLLSGSDACFASIILTFLTHYRTNYFPCSSRSLVVKRTVPFCQMWTTTGCI